MGQMKVWIEVLHLASRLNLKYLRRFIYLLFLPHFCFPWGCPWGNHAKCCMDAKRIRCLQIVSQHVPIYLQQFPSYSNRKCKKSPFSRTAAHIFVSPGDAPGAITLSVVWMEREFDGYKLSRCMCPSIYYRFWDTARYLWKKSSFYHTPFRSMSPSGGFPSEYRYPLWCGKTRMVSLPDGEKISKIYLFVLTWSTNVTDGRTDRRTLHDNKDRACIASRGKNLDLQV